MSLHSIWHQEEVTDNYEHAGWNLRQGLPVIGTAIIAILALSTSQCQKSSVAEKDIPKPPYPEQIIPAHPQIQ